MSEYRQDRITGALVLIAPRRGERPTPLRHDVGESMNQTFDPHCPFCPGNEDKLPDILEEVPVNDPPGWLVRVAPNKFPLLTPDATQRATDATAGYGFHEVIIETPRHDGDLASLPEENVEAVIRVYRQRCARLIARPDINSVLIFRNHGRGGGASLSHPHSQVVASALRPPHQAAAAAWAHAHFETTGESVIATEIERELNDGRRLIEASAHHVVLAPFAACAPFEQRIYPRSAALTFADIGDAALADFARLLQRALQRLKAAANDPAYNYVIESVGDGKADALWAYWGLRIVPDLATSGGFELGAGLAVNPSSPEADAEALRRALD